MAADPISAVKHGLTARGLHEAHDFQPGIALGASVHRQVGDHQSGFPEESRAMAVLKCYRQEIRPRWTGRRINRRPLRKSHPKVFTARAASFVRTPPNNRGGICVRLRALYEISPERHQFSSPGRLRIRPSRPAPTRIIRTTPGIGPGIRRWSSV